ncbi:MAG: thioredoxin family protein [Planctomycetota bacterium]
MSTPTTPTASLTDASYLRAKHEAGHVYADYVATGNEGLQSAWQNTYDQIELTDEQTKLLGDFVREINVTVVSGMWCGDCVRQGPMIQKIAEAAGTQGGGKINLKWVDRDEHMDLQQKVTVNAGNRVPIVVFAAEDHELVGWAGDKLLSRYRIAAAQALGANCPLPGAPVPKEELDAEIQDWVDQFERVHLLLRLSGRLRKKHND